MDLAFLILLLPLIGFAINVVAGKRLGERAGWVATAAVGGAFIFTLVSWLDMLTHISEQRRETRQLFEWLHVGSFNVDVTLLIDPLSITMALFVSGVSTLIHLYSIGYMKGDPKYHHFFIYLNLFVFSMLTLVLADNFLLMFLGWEGVGVCSYFLVGFWFERSSAATAAKKAFVVNRIGDAGLLLGMFVMFGAVGTLDYFADGYGAIELLPEVASGTATAVVLLLFVGAIGKSAQLPLHVWLPDAMEGPTPVSALIHAATMVTAGVYLMARVAPVLVGLDAASDVIMLVGALSALFAATIACAQTDIKRVLAYSTMSQLGYMFLAIGVGAYTAGVFHMITHAFFKALLFLSAGAIIHALHDEQNLKKMGNLRKYLPITFGSFLIGWLAISGIPPFSGFWSKDEVLVAVWEHNKFFYAVALFTVLLTAYYMSRLFFLAFYGKDRWKTADAKVEKSAKKHNLPHEAPRTMAIPMIVLAVLSALGGLLNLPFAPFEHVLDNFLGTVFEFQLTQAHITADVTAVLPSPPHDPPELLLNIIGVGVALLGIGAAWLIARSAPAASPWPTKLEPTVLARAWFVDTLYSWIIEKPGRVLSYWLDVVDRRVIDGAVSGSVWLVATTGTGLRKLQTGYVRNYALSIAGGASLLLVWALFRSVS